MFLKPVGWFLAYSGILALLELELINEVYELRSSLKVVIEVLRLLLQFELVCVGLFLFGS